MVAHFKYSPLAHPVILLVDNDDGANGLFSILKQKHITISHTTTALFYRIVRNLYLIKTPELGPNGRSKIEDFFKPATLTTTISGKKFNANNEIETATEYGKNVFAERVIAPQAATIDFSDFVPLIDRIVAAISHHGGLVANGAV
jgi:RNA-directed DNA polymerase